ncbi:hypothetical protein EDC04DRAFT_2603177 [Pisolithus marmoratus]|nr:hypothetical protein EDC04DRAFT_2603177 [Pisolithus marmoratus]
MSSIMLNFSVPPSMLISIKASIEHVPTLLPLKMKMIAFTSPAVCMFTPLIPLYIPRMVTVSSVYEETHKTQEHYYFVPAFGHISSSFPTAIVWMGPYALPVFNVYKEFAHLHCHALSPSQGIIKTMDLTKAQCAIWATRSMFQLTLFVWLADTFQYIPKIIAKAAQHAFAESDQTEPASPIMAMTSDQVGHGIPTFANAATSVTDLIIKSGVEHDSIIIMSCNKVVSYEAVTMKVSIKASTMAPSSLITATPTVQTSLHPNQFLPLQQEVSALSPVGSLYDRTMGQNIRIFVSWSLGDGVPGI